MSILNIYVSNPEYHEKYDIAIKKHNNQGIFHDSGFDLFVMEHTEFTENAINTHDTDVKASCYSFDGDKKQFNGFWLLPRSSISKTPLMLANSIGLIDSGYRGNLMAKFRNMSNETFVSKPGERLVQIAMGSLERFTVVRVNTIEELSEQTDRGDGGFGSSGL